MTTVCPGEVLNVQKCAYCMAFHYRIQHIPRSENSKCVIKYNYFVGKKSGFQYLIPLLLLSSVVDVTNHSKAFK